MGKNKIGLTMAYLSEKEQLEIFDVWLYKLHEGERYDLITKIIFKATKYATTDKKRVRQRLDMRTTEDWMEKRFTKDFSLFPVQVASECRKYKGWDLRMKPLLIKTAQKVKLRVRARNKKNVVDMEMA